MSGALEVENGDEEELLSAVHRNDNRRSDGALTRRIGGRRGGEGE